MIAGEDHLTIVFSNTKNMRMVKQNCMFTGLSRGLYAGFKFSVLYQLYQSVNNESTFKIYFLNKLYFYNCRVWRMARVITIAVPHSPFFNHGDFSFHCIVKVVREATHMEDLCQTCMHRTDGVVQRTSPLHESSRPLWAAVLRGLKVLEMEGPGVCAELGSRCSIRKQNWRLSESITSSVPVGGESTAQYSSQL